MTLWVWLLVCAKIVYILVRICWWSRIEYFVTLCVCVIQWTTVPKLTLCLILGDVPFSRFISFAYFKNSNRTGQQHTQENEKGDEQSAMARILHQNARDVIDVASNETPIEQHEYHDRARQYKWVDWVRERECVCMYVCIWVVLRNCVPILWHRYRKI